MDVLQNLAVARIGLGKPLHVIDELSGHLRPALLRKISGVGVDVTMLDRKGKLRASWDVSLYTAAGSRLAYPLCHGLDF
jgi:hypothetical protein